MRLFNHKRLADLLESPTVKPSGVAKVAGISVQGLNLIKDGKSEPKANTLARLADALGKPLEYFFDETCKDTYGRRTSA